MGMHLDSNPKETNTSVKIMDMEIDVLEKEVLLKKLKEYLSNDSLNVIHFMSVDLLDECVNRQELRELLEQADLRLPGEKAVLSLHHGDLLETAGMNVDYQSFISVMMELRKKQNSVFILARNEKEMEFYKNLYTRITPIGNVVGQDYIDEDSTSEAVVNEINTQTPDILVLSMEVAKQEEWLEENKLRVNAKLCIVLGDLSEKLMRDYKEAPLLFRRLGWENLYYKCKNRINVFNALQIRIFRKKMVNYYNKKD